MALTFILDIEGEDVVAEVLPLRGTFNKRIGMLQHMGDAIVKVVHAAGIAIPARDIVVASLAERTVERWQIVLADIRVVAPTAQLVAVVQCDCEFDVCRRSLSEANPTDEGR